jgi:arylsulfatase A-like enzyme
MTRREFISKSSLFVAGAAVTPGLLRASEAGLKAGKPNVIVIVADDLTPRYLGCYGGPTPTPNLNALAAQGVRFTNAHAVAPLCNPSRYTLLTGQFPGRNEFAYTRSEAGTPYWLGQTTRWVPDDPSIARTMKGAGYCTGYVGKWHSNFELGTPLGWDAGMDPDDAETNAMLKERHAAHVEEIKGLTGFDHVGNLQVGNLDRKAAQCPKAGYHNPEWQTQGALDFIDTAVGRGKPFFLHLANSIPHSPDNLKVLEQDSRYTQGGKLDKPLTCHPPRATVMERLKQAGLNTSGPLASINAGTIMLDDQLGALLKKLQEQEVADDTMIIWLADHSIYGKGTVYTPGTHVPMIAVWPNGLPSGKEVTVPVSLIDLFPTCVMAAGGKLPEKGIDGKDLLPLLTGRESGRGPVYNEMAWHRGVINDRYHFVAFRPPADVLKQMEDGEIAFLADKPSGDQIDIFGNLNLPFKPCMYDPDQLYDLEIDPFERTNLAYHPAYADVVKEMKAELGKVLATFKRPFQLDVPPFMQTKKYAGLVAKRKEMADAREHYPEPYDAERIYNLNLRDPLAG